VSPGVSPGRRAFVVVIDACGVGALPDSDRYGDEGANTLAHVADAVGGLRLANLARLGLGSIIPLRGVPAVADPVVHGRLHPLGPGKDSTVGHWEMMGVVLADAMPTYREGFSPDLVDRLEQAMGHRVTCNRPCDGVSVIERYGEEHLRTGRLILYTSQDSVLQLAAHADLVPIDALYRACEAARAVMRGPDAVGRVIARPFVGSPGAFRRCAGRRDYSVPPPGRSYLQELADVGVHTHAVGKVGELFAGVGIGHSHPAATNERAMACVATLLAELDEGLVFANLIETDQVYGHRKDVQGFHRALGEIDAQVGAWLNALRPEDLLVLTADHGVDPLSAGHDHTREYAPLLAVTGRERIGWPQARGASAPESRRHDGPLADVGATALWWLTGEVTDGLPGRPFHGL